MAIMITESDDALNLAAYCSIEISAFQVFPTITPCSLDNVTHPKQTSISCNTIAVRQINKRTVGPDRYRFKCFLNTNLNKQYRKSALKMPIEQRPFAADEDIVGLFHVRSIFFNDIHSLVFGFTGLPFLLIWQHLANSLFTTIIFVINFSSHCNSIGHYFGFDCGTLGTGN